MNPEDLLQPDQLLRINIPPGMSNNKKAKWLKHRMPQHMIPKVLSSLVYVEMKKKEANGAFIQEYLSQNNLTKGTDTAVRPPQAQSTGSKVAPIPGEKGYPERAEEPAAPEAPKKDAEPHHVGKPPTEVPAEQVPVFSPRQVEETKAFIVDAATKAAVDRHGKIIDTPSGLEQMTKQVEPFAKQFGGALAISNVARWPLETFVQYMKHDPVAGAKIAFWLSVELINTSKMLDTLTAPHEKKGESHKFEHEHPQQQVAGGGRRSRVAPIPA